MKYMGSKSRIAKHIVPIIQTYINIYRVENYCEPFVGGANIIDKVKAKHKYGYDNQKYLIALYNNLNRLNELPKTVTKEHYSDARDSFNNGDKRYEDWYIGAIGFLSSCNGRFFDGGYAGLVSDGAGNNRSYYDEARRNLESQVNSLRGIEFIHQSYTNIRKDISGWLFYCDPPYKDTKQYNSSKNFNHDEFWEWVRDMSKNNIVIVSECQAPDDFDIMWEKDVTRSMAITNRDTSKEKLFMHNSIS